MTPLIEHYQTLSKEDQKKLCKRYYEWASRHDCAVTGVEYPYTGKAHHLRLPNNAGTSLKPPHIYMIPMIDDIHTDIETKSVGWAENYWSKELGYKVCFIDILERLHKEFMG